MQDFSNSSALAVELPQSCAKHRRVIFSPIDPPEEMVVI